MIFLNRKLWTGWMGWNLQDGHSFFFYFKSSILKKSLECKYIDTKVSNDSRMQFVRIMIRVTLLDSFVKRHETVYNLFIEHVHKGLFSNFRTASNNIIGLSTLNPLSTFSSHRSNSRTRSRSKHSTNAIVWVAFNGALPLFNVCNCRYRPDIIRHS